MRKEKRKASKISEILEIPKEISSNEPKLTIVGFNEMIIENYKGILEYEEFYVRINTFIGTINVNGFGLGLTQMNDEAICITGKIESLDIERTTDEGEI